MARKPEIEGRWAVVTGASSGIGLEFSRALATKGCNIVAISNQPKELAETAQMLQSEFEVETVTLDLDLTRPDATERVMELLDSHAIVPLLLINNAGIFDFRAVERLSPRRLDLYIDLHIRALSHLSRSVTMLMAERGGSGYILNMSSMSCWMPMPGIAMYSATKSYIRAFSRALRIEMKQRGVSVTVACPGGIATDLFGLPRKLQRVGVAVGALSTPRAFVRHALDRTFRRKAQYINGPVNRLAIVFVASLPEWARILIKTKLLDRLDK